MRSAAVGPPSVASCSSSMLSRPRPVAVVAHSLLPAPRRSRNKRSPASNSSRSKSGPHAGPRGAHRIPWPIAAAADEDAATSAASTSTAVVVVPAAGSSSDAAPAPLPSLPQSGVGTTALDASALPALDAAVSLPGFVDQLPSSSSSDSVADAAAAPSSPPPPLPPSSSSPFSFSVPPAVRGMLAINLGAALFGSNMVAVKLAQAAGASPAALSAGRFALAAAVFLPSAVSALRPTTTTTTTEEEEKEEKDDDESERKVSPSPPPPSPSLLARSGLELGLYLFGGYSGQAVGLSLTTASRGAFASAFTVLAVPVLQAAAAALRRKGEGEGGGAGASPPPPPALTWVAAAAAVAGVFLLTSDGGGGGGGGAGAGGGGASAAAATAAATVAAAATAGPNFGDLLCVLSAVLFGVHKWRSEQLVERLSAAAAGEGGGERSSDSSDSGSIGGSNEETVRSLVALQLCVLAAASVALCVPEAAGAVRGALADQRSAFFDLASASSASSASASVSSASASASSSAASLAFYAAVAGQLWSEFAGLPWLLFAYMGLFTTAWTIDAEAKALRHVSASTAALIYSSEPLWGALFAAIFLGERFEGAKGWVGAFLVVGSSLVAQVGGAAGKGGGKVGEEERGEKGGERATVEVKK